MRAAVLLSWTLLACSGDGMMMSTDDAAGPVRNDSGVTADSQTSDVAIDVQAPAPPSCDPGDRAEWTGTIPNTAIAVAVCSACGESYVVAANGDALPKDVSIDNGTKMITTTVPAGGKLASAKIADKSDGTVTVCAAKDCLPMAVDNKEYCNPFRAITKLRAERIDQGVDYGGSGPIYALGPGTIDLYRNRNDSGWPGGTFMSYKLTAGPASGKTIYLAENIDLDTSLHSGSHVFSGTVLGTLVNASPDCEIGWGVQGAGYTAEHSCYTEGCMTPLGMNFNDLLVCLKTPSGTKGTSGCCTGTMGYPSDWCSLLSAWQ